MLCKNKITNKYYQIVPSDSGDEWAVKPWNSKSNMWQLLSNADLKNDFIRIRPGKDKCSLFTV